MPKPCSLELRERVVEAVESGASRREAAECFDVSASAAIKWMQRRRETGSIAPKPCGGTAALQAASVNAARAIGASVLIGLAPSERIESFAEDSPRGPASTLTAGQMS